MFHESARVRLAGMQAPASTGGCKSIVREWSTTACHLAAQLCPVHEQPAALQVELLQAQRRRQLQRQQREYLRVQRLQGGRQPAQVGAHKVDQAAGRGQREGWVSGLRHSGEVAGPALCTARACPLWRSPFKELPLVAHVER